MKLQQDQVWQVGESFLRIVRLERLSVAYKEFTDLRTRDGRHHEVSKKEFCRTIKGAKRLSREEIPDRWNTLADS